MKLQSLGVLVWLCTKGESFRSIRFGTFLQVKTPIRIVGHGATVRDERDEGLEALKLNESNLSPEEIERLAFIQKLTTEADEMVRKAGFSIDGEQDADEIERAVKDTKWSGQSDVEKTIASSNNYEDLKNRIDLAVVDLLALLTFAVVGRSNHGEDVGVISVVSTAFPFLITWFAFAPFAGAYSRKSTSSKAGIPQGVATAWGVAVPLALAVRGLLKDSVPPTPFIIVSLVATFALLCIYRLVYLLLVGETSDQEYKSAGLLEVFKMVTTLLRRW